MFSSVKKNTKGVTLLLSMLIMTTVVAVAIGVSVLIINEYQFSSNVDHAITAFYAAESGLETKLATIKTDRDVAGQTLATTLGDMTGSGSLVDIPNNWSSGWQTTAESTADYLLGHLKANEKVTIDLFDLENFGSAGGGVDRATINWRDDCSGNGLANGNGWLKVSETSLTAGGGSDPATGATNPYENIYPCGSAVSCNPIDYSHLSVNNNYRLAVTPIYCDAIFLKVNAYDNANNAKKISNRILLKSRGTYSTSQIVLTANVPWQLPAAGIFDFVLFSELIIEK
ncbi:MAG: hypothetical protein WC528_01230 [Patescibacteria group bacterium]